MDLIRRLIHRPQPNLLSGPLWRGILVLALPVIGAQILQSAQFLVDMFFVGKLENGAQAVAAIGMSRRIHWVVMTLLIGTQAAAVAVVSRAIGARDTRRASHVAGQVMVLAILFSLVVTPLGVIFSDEALQVFGAEEEVVNMAVGYLRIIFGGIFGLITMILLTAVFHGTGDTITPLLLGIGTTIVNLTLNPILIFGLLGMPALGVRGSGVATIIAAGSMSVVAFVLFLRGRSGVKLHLRDFVPRVPTLWRLLVIGVPASMNTSLLAVMQMMLMAIITKFGTVVLAAYAVGSQVRMTGMLPIFGFAAATSTTVGQNLGAHQEQRAMRSGWTGMGMALAGSFVMATIMFLFGGQLTAIFNDDPEVVAAGAHFLGVTALAMAIAPVFGVLGRAMSGAGDTTSPLLINLCCRWGIQIPVAILLSGIHELWGVAIPFREALGDRLVFDESGIWYATVLAAVLQSVIVMAWYTTGRWKHRKV